MTWEKVKSFVIGGGLIIVWGITLAFLDWRVSVAVTTALTDQDIGTDTKIIAMDASTATNTNDIADNAADIAEEKRRLEAVANILMGGTGS